MKFYRCNTCGQIFMTIKDRKITPTCCGTSMEEIIPHTDETGLNEKHIPVFKMDENKVYVKIGEIPHPMVEEHYIEWVLLVTNKGSQRKELKPGQSPRVDFFLEPDEYVKEIYAYCNIHSLWKLNAEKIECGCNS